MIINMISVKFLILCRHLMKEVLNYCKPEYNNNVSPINLTVIAKTPLFFFGVCDW